MGKGILSFPRSQSDEEVKQRATLHNLVFSKCVGQELSKIPKVAAHTHPSGWEMKV